MLTSQDDPSAARTAPAQTAPAQTAPAQTAPAQTAPAQTAPAQTAPAQTAPVMPPGLTLTRTTPEFTESSVPPGLLRAHHVAAGLWGRVCVRAGELRFVFEDSPGTSHQLRAGDSLDIPPAVAHRVEPADTVRFVVEFYGPTPANVPPPLLNALRPFGARSTTTGPAASGARVLAQLETVTALAIDVDRADFTGPTQTCANDQYLFTIDGALTVDLGDRQLTAEAGSLIFVPAGAPHRLIGDAQSEIATRILDFIVPSLLAGQPLFAAATFDEPQAGGFVSSLGAEAFASGSRPGGLALQTLTDPARGSVSCVVNAVQVLAGGAGPSTHIHTFDQLFFVLQGRLEVEVAGRRVAAERHDLVVLPAGVPHNQWNEGEQTEVHLAVLVPPPASGEPVARSVEFHLI